MLQRLCLDRHLDSTSIIHYLFICCPTE